MHKVEIIKININFFSLKIYTEIYIISCMIYIIHTKGRILYHIFYIYDMYYKFIHSIRKSMTTQTTALHQYCNTCTPALWPAGTLALQHHSSFYSIINIIIIMLLDCTYYDYYYYVIINNYSKVM